MASLAPTHSERDLVVATRRGDDRAFEELYSRYRDRIGAFILAKVQDHGRAEDIAQEAFISALRRLRASEQQIAFKPWIYEIAKNACIDEFRRCRRAREVSLDADEEFGGGECGLVSIAPSPPAAVESKQQLDDLQGAFGGLSENHHSLLVMREFEGLSYSEIGARTGMSRQVVESTLFRARRKLTREYDEIASGRRCQQVATLIEAGGPQSLASCGIRQRRQLTRHLAYCQPCRRKALQAGVDESLVKPRSIAAKIAALLPFGLSRWPWGGRGAGKTAAGKGGTAGAGSLSASTTVAGSAGSSITLGQAATAAAALLIAGVGGGAVTGAFAGKPASHPVHARAVSTTHRGGSQSRGGSGGSAGGASAGHSTRPVLRRSSPQPRSHIGHSSATGGGGAAKSPGPSRPAGTNSASGSTPGASATKGSNLGLGSASAAGATPPAKTATGPVRTVTGTASKTLTGTARTVTGAANTLTGTAKKVTSTVGGAASSAGSTARQAANTATSAVGGAASSAGSTATQAANTATSAVGGAASPAGSTATQAANTVTSAADNAGSTAQDAGSTAQDAASNATTLASGATSTVNGTTQRAAGTLASAASNLVP